jgi:hypothetical protein
MILPLTSKGKFLFYYTLTTITEVTGIYIVVTAYFIDEKCSNRGREPIIYNFTNRSEAEKSYTEISNKMYENYKKEFEN